MWRKRQNGSGASSTVPNVSLLRQLSQVGSAEEVRHGGVVVGDGRESFARQLSPVVEAHTPLLQHLEHRGVVLRFADHDAVLEVLRGTDQESCPSHIDRSEERRVGKECRL